MERNEIIADHGDWIEVDISTAKYPNSIMKIDKIDYEFVKGFSNGRIMIDPQYTRNYCVFNSGKKYYTHKIILPSARIVDHINGDCLDNRFKNLRSVSGSQNQWNKIVKSGSSSGLKGVSKSGDVWMAQITYDGRRHYLGSFATKQEASEKYKEQSLKHHGEYSYFNREQ